ncbi:MAG: hypothetical protein M3Q65_24900, partial [Chloroflexota bacterium]|nr:hypothetical protein [Chloroflexota bacterium]
AGNVTDPQLSKDLGDAAGALDRPDAAGAQSALDRVASDVDRLGQGQQAQGQNGQPSAPQGPQGQRGNAGPGGSPQSGDGGGTGASPRLPGDQRSNPAPGPGTPPLGTDGKPVELPKGDARGPLIDSQGQGNRGNRGPTDPGGASVGDGQLRQGAVGEAGPEVNGVPVEQRGAVERYFTPRPDRPGGGD